MECSHKRLREKKSMALSNRKQVEKLNKIKNTSTEEEILYGLQTKDHSLQSSTLDIIYKRTTQRKRVSLVSKENIECKCIKISNEIKKKSICTMSKKEESLSGKVKLMIGEQMDILNNDFFNQKLKSLNRRVEQVQCKQTHEEIAKTFLKKVSKLDRRINAAMAFQEEVFSKMAVRQIMLPGADYQNTVLNQFGPSAFCPDIINIPTSSSNTLLLSPYTGFASAHVSRYIRCPVLLLVSPPYPLQLKLDDQFLKCFRVCEGTDFLLNDSQKKICKEIFIEQTEFKASVPQLRFLKLREETSNETFKPFPHLPPLPRIPLGPELAEEFKDPPLNPETKSGLCAKSKGDCTVMDPYRNGSKVCFPTELSLVSVPRKPK